MFTWPDEAENIICSINALFSLSAPMVTAMSYFSSYSHFLVLYSYVVSYLRLFMDNADKPCVFWLGKCATTIQLRNVLFPRNVGVARRKFINFMTNFILDISSNKSKKISQKCQSTERACTKYFNNELDHKKKQLLYSFVFRKWESFLAVIVVTASMCTIAINLLCHIYDSARFLWMLHGGG
jgi:hypothetical protein